MYERKEESSRFVAPDLQKDQQELWIKEADPLALRHLPNSVEVAPLEEEDIQRVIAQGGMSILEEMSVLSLPPSPPPPPSVGRPGIWQSRSKRRSFIILASVLASLLILNGLLILFNLSNHHTHANGGRGPDTHPMLTVTSTAAHPGQIVGVHISNFSASAHVLLTRDIQQAVRTDAGSPLIKLGVNGDADVRILVQDSWGPGNHILVAEDTHTHYTASVALQVISDFPLPPPHLVVSSPDQPDGLTGPLQMGAQLQGANTIQSLLLRNIGGSWISWTAVSNQPWLLMAPSQGIFQDSQSIFIAAARAHLKPGDYQGAITVVSNTGRAIVIQVLMTVLPLPTITSAFIVIVPPVLSFTTTDGAMDLSSQQLDISNGGAQPLNWSLVVNAPENLFNQNVYGQDDVSWLSANMTSGIIAPRAAAKLQVIVSSRDLLPGVYSGLLLFNADGDTVNAPQSVAISLTVQQRCGVAVSRPGISLMLAAGQHLSLNQSVSLSTTLGCAEVTNWQGFPLASWLSITPASGQLQPGVAIRTALLIDTSKLTPGTYSGWIDLLTEMRSQTLQVQITVASSASATGVPAGGQTSTGVPGNPTVMPSNTAVSGDPTVGPSSTPGPGTPTPIPSSTPTPTPHPCVLQVTPANLAFIASVLQPDPPGQQLVLKATGNCARPVAWSASVNGNGQGWLSLSATSGSLGRNGSTIVVYAHGGGKELGTYRGQITLTAVEQGGVTTQGSPQHIPVTMTVIV